MKKLKNPEGWMTKPIERGSYWSYFVGQNIYYNLTAAFITTYLAMQGISLAKAGLVLLVVKIWDAINDPLFGYIFDKVKFKSGKKSIPWLRIAVLFIPVVTIAVFGIPAGLSENGKLIWFGVAYILWDSVYTLTDVPAYSMLTTMTDNLQERGTLLALNRIFSGVGGALYSVVLTFLISEAVGLSVTWSVVILSVFSALTMVPLCIFGKERNYKPEQEDESFSIRQMVSYLLKNKYLLIFYGGYFVTDGLKTSGAVALFAAFYLFGSANFNIVLSAVGMVPGFLVALAMPVLIRKFDKFKMLVWSNLANIVLGFIIYFAGWENQILFLVLTVIRSIPLSIAGNLYFMFTPDCAEYGQYKSGIAAKGITFSIQTFTVKITSAVATSLALFLLGLFSWVNVEAQSFAELEAMGVTQSPLAMQGLWFVYALMPVIGLAISAVFFWFYKLNDKDVQIMAKCNAGEISREEAEAQLSGKY